MTKSSRPDTAPSKPEGPTLNPLVIFKRCFAWEGRFSRGEFAVAFGFTHAALLVFIVSAGRILDPQGAAPAAVAFLPFFACLPIWIPIAAGATVRRLNDLALPRLWLLAFLAPMVNLVLVAALLFARSRATSHSPNSELPS